MDPYYSVPTLGNPWIYVKQGSWLDTWTFWHLVILSSMPIDVICGHLKRTKKCFVTNREHSICIFNPLCQTTFKTPGGKLQTYTWNAVCSWCDFCGSFITKQWFNYFMYLLHLWAVKSHAKVVLNWTTFHILVLRLPARSTSVTKKPGCSD